MSAIALIEGARPCARLEGWPRVRTLSPSFETAAVRPPQDEVCQCGRTSQHPLQMLGILPSSLSFSLTAARVSERRNLVVACRVRFILTTRLTGNVRDTAGADAPGTGTGLIAGGGAAGTLPALPMPLGSLTEPFSPRAFAGPGGMPLTPASCASDPGTATTPSTATLSTATLSNAVLPIVHPRQKVETSCAHFIVGRSFADLFI